MVECRHAGELPCRQTAPVVSEVLVDLSEIGCGAVPNLQPSGRVEVVDGPCDVAARRARPPSGGTSV